MGEYDARVAATQTNSTARASIERCTIDAIDGVEFVEFTSHEDDRGAFTEVHRATWTPALVPAQWNLVRSRANVLRGVHCHVDHGDYLILVDGAMLLGLHDLRADSPTCGASLLVALAPARQAVVIPPGVAHGFWFTEPSTTLYAVSHEWNPLDELGCRFDDPELELRWPHAEPLLSPRDTTAGSLSELRAAVRAGLAARVNAPVGS